MSSRPRRKSIDSDSDSEAIDHGYFPTGYSSPNLAAQFPSVHGSPQFPSGSATPQFPTTPIPQYLDKTHPIQLPSPEVSPSQDKKYTANEKTFGAERMPPSYASATSPPAPPPSGFRIPLTATAAFPDPQTLGEPPCHDLDGSPIYIGSALLATSVHPCKIGKHLQPPVSIPYGGKEYGHHGRYDLLPYKPDQMEFVPTSFGRIPPGRRPIEGGYEDHGAKMYHAVAWIDGIRVPGKTAEHLGACNVAFGGAEIIIRSNYEILCWR